MKIYVAGPYTKGDVVVNVRNAILAADRLLKAGHEPFVPHLNHFWHLVCPGDYEQWLRLDLKWLPTCDYILRLPGESAGADREVALATSLGMRVYYNIDELLGGLSND
jgi:hypothetical protein